MKEDMHISFRHLYFNIQRNIPILRWFLPLPGGWMNLLVFSDFVLQNLCTEVSRGLEIKNIIFQNYVSNVKLSTYENYFKAHFFLRMDEHAVSIPGVWFFIIHFNIFISLFSTILLNSFRGNYLKIINKCRTHY